MNYWIIIIPTVETFVFYGWEREAFFETENKSKWYNVKGKYKLADKKDPKDFEMVQLEIIGSQQDRKAQSDIPYMPREGWF